MKKIRNFDIQHKLGSGSYGVIYKALNKATKQICVLKQISLGRLSEKAKKSAINEATIMGKLVHPFIVRYRQSFIEDNTLNIIMQYCDNGDLNHFLKMQNKRPLKEDKIWKIFISICFGLQYIHKNKILHRDIKSLNIFLNKQEDVKIGDLGVAKMLTSNEFAQTMVGTPFYLSPQLCQEKPYNEKSDIWALGCLLYELCTFRHPFEAQNQASLILKIIRGKYSPIPEMYSKDLKQMIDLCLERDYKRRPTTSNLLARPKILLKIEELGINTLLEDQLKKITRQKQNIVVKPQVVQEKPATVKQYKVVKAMDVDSRKVIKAVDNEPKNEPIKKQVVKQQSKKEQIQKKNEPISKREPIIILPKPITHSERKIQPVDAKKEKEARPPKQSKNDFVNNLEKMIDAEQKDKNNRKYSQGYIQSPIISSDIKKDNRIQKVAERVEEIKNKNDKNIQLFKSPSLNEAKRQTPSISNKKSSSNSHENNAIKKQQAVKIPVMPNKPPIAPSSQNKEPLITKVKNQKVIQPKVFESHKNLNKPSGIIKSGGFSSNFEFEKAEKEKYISNSRDKLTSAKRSSIPNIKVDKDKQPPKVLFGPSPVPTPSVQNKSQKMIKHSGYSALYEDRKKQEFNKNSRVRKGGRNELARNAKNPSRYNQISKEQEAEVMNLPTNLKSNGVESSDSQEEPGTHKQSHIIEDLKRKSNQNKFKLKQINHDLVLQKYQDMLKSADEETSREQQESQPFREKGSSEEEMDQQLERQIKEGMSSQNQEEVVMSDEENIAEDLEVVKKNSRNSNDPIQEQLQNEVLQQDFQRVQEYDRQDEEQQPMYESQRNQQWSFDQEPQLPLMEDKESPYFEAPNPYLVEQQEETTENKINYLQTKLEENMKRQDEINKLMQIKLEECRKYVGNEKTLTQILVFFRNKLHMQDDFNETDEKEVEGFLARKGLTDHYKFQNIYKIMHFEMQLQNTRKIIQRICKRLSEFEEAS